VDIALHIYGGMWYRGAMLPFSLAQIVVEHPAWAKVLDRHGIDYRCAGRQLLTQTCVPRGLDAAAIEREMRATPEEPGARAEVLEGVLTHVLTDHHAFLRRELPRLGEMLEGVEAFPGGPDLNKLRDAYRHFAVDLLEHLHHEEDDLFPACRGLVAGDTSPADRERLAKAVRDMFAEHSAASDEMERLRGLTGDYMPPEGAPPAYRELLGAMSAMDADTHRHMHEENNLIVPLALGVLGAQAVGAG